MGQILTLDGKGKPEAYSGGRSTMAVKGTFGGGTVGLEWCDANSDLTNNANWFIVNNSSGAITFTSKGLTNFELGAGFIRPTLTSSTAAAAEIIFAGSIGTPSGRP